MLFKLLEDLRFTIGLFFALVSVLLGLASFHSQLSSFPHPWISHAEVTVNLNLIASAYIGVFSIFMMSLGLFAVNPLQTKIADPLNL